MVKVWYNLLDRQTDRQTDRQGLVSGFIWMLRNIERHFSVAK